MRSVGADLGPIPRHQLWNGRRDLVCLVVDQIPARGSPEEDVNQGAPGHAGVGLSCAVGLDRMAGRGRVMGGRGDGFDLPRRRRSRALPLLASDLRSAAGSWAEIRQVAGREPGRRGNLQLRCAG